MEADALRDAVECQFAMFEDREAGIQGLEDAWRNLRLAVGRGALKMRGRRAAAFPSKAEAVFPGEKAFTETVSITAENLHDFCQIDITECELRYPLPNQESVVWADSQAAADSALASCDYVYRDVAVCRNDLMKIKPSRGAPAQPSDELPPLAKDKLAKWFSALSTKNRNKSQQDLWNYCQLAHPGHSIARERIRELTMGQKQGPRQFGEKATAK